MKKALFFVFMTGWLLIGQSVAESAHPSVQILEAYIDIRTGPGRGYPVFYVAEKGEWVEILKRKTEWFKVRTEREKEGWIHRDQIEKTISTRGEPVVFRDPTLASFSERRWELGYLAGDLEGADVISGYASWHFTENLSTEFQFAEASGSFSDSRYITLNIVNQPFPTWRYSPFVSLGFGRINIDPTTVLVQAQDDARSDEMLNVGAGVRVYLTRRFLLRAEYKNYVILTNRNDNQEIEEWKAGFAVFF